MILYITVCMYLVYQKRFIPPPSDSQVVLSDLISEGEKRNEDLQDLLAIGQTTLSVSCNNLLD